MAGQRHRPDLRNLKFQNHMHNLLINDNYYGIT